MGTAVGFVFSVPEVSLREFKEHDVILRSSGEVFYYPPANLTMPCLNVTETNELECNFAVGSWTLLIDMLDLHLTNSQLDLSHIVIDPRYKIKCTPRNVYDFFTRFVLFFSTFSGRKNNNYSRLP